MPIERRNAIVPLARRHGTDLNPTDTASTLMESFEMIPNDCHGELTTRTGLRLDVRRARPEDEATLAEFFTHVTPDDLRFRFLSAMREVSHQQLVDMTRTGDGETDNFLAFSKSGLLIAVAMLASDQAHRNGEVAMSIRADHKHLGVSWELLEHVARYAEAHGIESLESIESRDNHSAIELERDMGFSITPYPDDLRLLLIRKELDGGSTRVQDVPVRAA